MIKVLNQYLKAADVVLHPSFVLFFSNQLIKPTLASCRYFLFAYIKNSFVENLFLGLKKLDRHLLIFRDTLGTAVSSSGELCLVCQVCSIREFLLLNSSE